MWQHNPLTKIFSANLHICQSLSSILWSPPISSVSVLSAHLYLCYHINLSFRVSCAFFSQPISMVVVPSISPSKSLLYLFSKPISLSVVPCICPSVSILYLYANSPSLYLYSHLSVLPCLLYICSLSPSLSLLFYLSVLLSLFCICICGPSICPSESLLYLFSHPVSISVARAISPFKSLLYLFSHSICIYGPNYLSFRVYSVSVISAHSVSIFLSICHSELFLICYLNSYLYL